MASPYMSPYLEEAKKRAQMLRQLGVTDEDMVAAGSGNPYGISPEQFRDLSINTKPAAKRIERQRDFAQSLRQTPTPGVTQVGGIAAANPWSGVETAFNRALGGYMEGKANKADEGLDEKRNRLAQAVAARDAAMYGQQRGDVAFEQSMDLETLGETMRSNRTAEEAAAAEARRKAAADAAEAERAAAKLADDQASRRDTKQYQTPDGEIINTIEQDGILYEYLPDGTMGEPTTLPSGTIELDTQATGSTASLDSLAMRQEQAEKDARWESEVGTQVAIDEMGRTVDTMSQILTNPELENFTGFTNVSRILAPYGITEDAWIGQSIDKQLKYASTAGIAELASIFKPMSDTDLKYLLSQFPSAADDPKAITAWMSNQGRKAVEKQFQDRLASAKTPAEKANLNAAWAQTEAKLDANIAMAAKRQGIQPENAAQLGMTEEELLYLYANMGQ